MTQKPFLNLGCGRIILPAPKPAHHNLIPDGIHEFALWHNVDRNPQPGVDEVADVFRYPFPWADNSFDGALLTHLCEHIPHEIRAVNLPYIQNDVAAVAAEFLLRERYEAIANLQDGWFAFFSELYRVLTPDSLIHIISPYAWCDAAVGDPTHTRLLTPASFKHSMEPDPNAPFAYETGGLNLKMDDMPAMNLTAEYQHLLGRPELLKQALSSHLNVCYEFYVRLRVIK